MNVFIKKLLKPLGDPLLAFSRHNLGTKNPSESLPVGTRQKWSGEQAVRRMFNNDGM